MKHSKRILAYSALALIIMLAMIAAIAPAASSVAFAQSAPLAPDVTTTSPDDTTINISWDAVAGAASYVIAAYDQTDGHRTVGTVDHPTTTITDSDLDKGRTYYYWVRGINSDGGEGAWSDRALQVAGPAPSTPTGLTATGGYLKNAIAWEAVATAEHYEVWARLSIEPNNYRELDLTVSGTSYDHTGLTAGDQWYYWVRAVDSAGTMGLYAGPEITTVLAPPVLGMPSNLQAALGDTEITLTWGAPSSIPAGVTVTGYEYRYRESGVTFPATWTPDTGADLTETITGLTSGQAYDFEVRAIGNIGGPGVAASASKTPATVPGAPTLTATGGFGYIDLTWTAPADDGGAPITAYRIERQDSGIWGSPTSHPVAADSAKFSGLDNAVEYTYRIFAINVAGDSDWTPASAFTLAHAARVPGAPTNVMAMPGAGLVTLTWVAPAFNGGATITSYEYRQKEGEDSYGTWKAAGTKAAGTESPFEVPNLKPGTTYTFQVAARNTVGRGDEVGESEPAAVTSTAPTAAPPSFSALLGMNDGGGDQVALSWTDLGSAHYGGEENLQTGLSRSEARYDIQRKTSDASWPEEEENTTDADLGILGITLVATGNLYSALDPVLEPGTTYNYRIRAVNTIGGGPWSAEVRPVTTPPDPPGELENSSESANNAPLTTGAGTGAIRITWMAPEDTGGADITSYDLQVRTGDSVFEDISEQPPIEDPDNNTIGNLPAANMDYTHRGVTEDVDHFYRVRAVNSAGNGPWSDASAGIKSDAAAQGAPDAPTLSSMPIVLDGSTITFTWTPPAEGGTLPITGYVVQYQRDDADDDSDFSDGNVATIPSPVTTIFKHENVEGGATGPTETRVNFTWEYRVQAVNGNGGGAWSEVTRFPTPPRSPDAPELTATSTGSDSIRVTWTVPGANGSMITGYEIQRKTGTAQYDAITGIGQLAATVPLFVDTTGLAPATKYYYRVRALPRVGVGVDPDTGWSEESETTSATTETGVPGRPIIGAATAADSEDAGSGSVSLTLTPVPADQNGGSEITRYELRIWYNGQWNKADDLEANTTPQVIGDLTPGQLYYFATRAWNSAGGGPWSMLVSATASSGAPDTPDLTATAVDGESILLTWTVPEANGSTITGYELQVWDNATNGADWTTGNLLDAVDPLQSKFTTEFTHDLRLAGTEYFYRIRALTDTDASSEWSADDDTDAKSARTFGDVPAKIADAPGVQAATVADEAGMITVTWVAPPATGGSAITGYDIQIWDGDSQQWVDETSLGNVLTYTDTGLAVGTYYYRVRARNSEGPGPWSDHGSNMVSVLARAPVAPVITAVVLGTDSIRITWTEPESFGSAITSYRLQRWGSVLANQWPADDNDLRTGTDTSLNRLYIDEAVMPGTTYYYRVWATNGADPADSAWSEFVQATTVAAAPEAPTITETAETDITATSITLRWMAPANGGSAIIRYELEVWNTDSRTWVDVNNSISSASTSITLRNLESETRYIYRLRAVNRAPTNGGLGNWSTIHPVETE